jgi:hypothetical protein
VFSFGSSFNKALVQSLENVFVHANGILDLESTTTRPLWAAAHLPAFIQSSPFVEKIFRNVVANLGSDPNCNNLSPFPLKNIPLRQPHPSARNGYIMSLDASVYEWSIDAQSGMHGRRVWLTIS